jgi:hypothetical protein
VTHTPGPWRIRENARHDVDECDLSICGDIWVLADIHGPQYEHQRYNARLIAAAPDLLEALEKLHERYLLAIGNEGPEALAARSAIAKTVIA